MNVLFLSNDPSLCDPISPAHLRMRAYADEVAKTGGSLHILTRAKEVCEQQDGPLFVHGVRAFKLLSPWKLSKLGKKLILKHGIDIVSAQDPFEHGLAASWAVQGTKAKLHLQVHTDYLSPWFTRESIYRSPRVRMPFLNHVRVRVADRVVRKASGIRVVSERIKQSMLVRYGNGIPEPSVIPIPVSTDVPPKVELPPRPFTFTLIAVSRLEPEKRIPDLFAVLKRLKDAYPMLGLVLIGDGKERKRLEKLAQSWGVADKVLFLGWRTDAWGLMQSANAFIQASAYEGYGITLIEAALAGVPIITSDVGIVGEVFTGYENVFAAPVGDPTNLAALTAQFIEDSHARTVLSLEGKRVALGHLANVRNSPADIVADLAEALTRSV
ncbi:MAG TPA: glycosyltransferase [Candidatus Paceibacterota bacterium]